MAQLICSPAEDTIIFQPARLSIENDVPPVFDMTPNKLQLANKLRLYFASPSK